MTTSVPISAVGDRGREVSTALLERIFPVPRSFAIRLWDGTVLAADGPSSFTIVLNSRGALRRMFRPPLDLGLGESYIRGDFDVDGDLVEAVAALSRLDSPRRASQFADLARLWFLLPTDRHRSDEVGFAPAELRAAVRSREWEMSAIQYHYDLGNDFYE
jgi:cyclopropane-fatty-acyl-phospholipid synthase